MITLTPWPRPALARIGGPMAAIPQLNQPGVMRLCSNESPMGVSPLAVQAAAEALLRGHEYPEDEGAELVDAIAARFHVAPRNIRVGPGSDTLMAHAVMAFAGPGDEVVFSSRGYARYARNALIAGANPVPAEDLDFRADPQSLLDAMSSRTRFVMIANPDNPSGAMLSMDEITALHACLPGNVILLLDCAYAEYVRDPAYEDGGLALASSARNVIVSRTFSKLYGLAALRLGWLTAHEDLLDAIGKVGPTFPVGRTALAAGVAALGDVAHLQSARAHNDIHLPWLSAALPSEHVRVLPSQGNFVLLELAGATQARGLVDHLAAQGILVRGFGPGAHAAQVRVSIGAADAIRRAAEVIAEYTSTLERSGGSTGGRTGAKRR